jgi:hypothetical protein
MWNKVIADLRKKYNADYRKVRLIKDVNDLFIFMKAYDVNLSNEEFNEFILLYFSESPLDLIWI